MANDKKYETPVYKLPINSSFEPIMGLPAEEGPSTWSSTTTAALKFDSNKPGMDLLPVAAKRAIAEVFDFGAKKYARHNWRNGFNYSRLIAAMERHIDAFNDGEDNDPESGKSHLAHAGCCVLMLLESVIKGYGTDDRYKSPGSKAITTHTIPLHNVSWQYTKEEGLKQAAKEMNDLNNSIKQIEKTNEQD